MSATPTPRWNVAVVDDVTGSSRSTAVSEGKHYRISATTDLWWVVKASAGSIVAATAAHFLKSGAEALFTVPVSGQHLYYIRHSADGKISLSEVEV